MTYEEFVNKYFEEHFWWLRNFHKIGWMYANGFIGNQTYEDLSKLKIKKFNGRLARFDKMLEEHYSKN